MSNPPKTRPLEDIIKDLTISLAYVNQKCALAVEVIRQQIEHHVELEINHSTVGDVVQATYHKEQVADLTESFELLQAAELEAPKVEEPSRIVRIH